MTWHSYFIAGPYRRLIRPDASQRELVVVGRLMTLLVGLLALGIALTMADLGGEGLFRTMMKMFSVTTAPVAIPMMMGLLTRKVTNTGALTGFLLGITVGTSAFIPAAPQERQRIAAFASRLAVPIGEADEDQTPPVTRDAVQVSPFRVVGVSTMLIGAMMLIVLAFVPAGLPFVMNLAVGSALLLVGGLLAWRCG